MKTGNKKKIMTHKKDGTVMRSVKDRGYKGERRDEGEGSSHL